MFYEIQSKLEQLSNIEKFQLEITQLKKEQLEIISECNEANRKEKLAQEQNAQLVDRISKLESDLVHQKLLNKEIKRDKLQFEFQNARHEQKVEQLQEDLKLYYMSGSANREGVLFDSFP